INPVAKLAAATVIGATLLTSIDRVSSSVALALELALIAVAGVPIGRIAVRCWPLVVAAALAGLTILLYGRPSGEIYARVLFAEISDGSIELAIATMLRVLAIALPAVILFLTVDPTDLADGLAQVLRLPARFVLGALGGMRLVGLFVDDWRSLELARRARGVADRGRLRRFAGMAFALLVLSVRRGSKLATAMEARAFGSPIRRTWARQSTIGRADVALVVTAVLIATAAVGAAVVTGEWNPVFVA
ncbi:MAG: hypothetical protein RI885_2572, partial [Actinomycetota bacterium]